MSHANPIGGLAQPDPHALKAAPIRLVRDDTPGFGSRAGRLSRRDIEFRLLRREIPPKGSIIILEGGHFFRPQGVGELAGGAGHFKGEADRAVVISRALRKDVLVRVIGLAAACVLLLQSLLMGTTRASPVIHDSAALSGLHHSDHGRARSLAALPAGAIQASTPAAHEHGDVARHDANDPAAPAKPPHCFWCILSKKLGHDLGPPPTIAALLSPSRDIVEMIFTIRTETSDHRLHLLPPLGARAPPDLV
ncbi:hypothetical protein [Microvirga massiliensis]|uniref:hypothetical protein n=1 Tax=Microvirga massiliensis TaxID=1033741 RepID=UPI00062B9946|nr:hypothetical protein [Microvirga massiliensis]